MTAANPIATRTPTSIRKRLINTDRPTSLHLQTVRRARASQDRSASQLCHGGTAADSDAQVAPVELFFDLVFVFALTQVTALMADDLTGRLAGALPALAALGLLATVSVGLIGYETVRFAAARDRIRHLEEIALPEREAADSAE